MELKLVMPKDTTWGVIGYDPEKRGGYNSRKPRFFCDNVFRGDNFVTEWAVKDGDVNGHEYKCIRQKIENLDDATVKTTTIEPYRYDVKFPEHETIQRLTKDGHYSLVRKVGDEIVGGYELKPVNRKFAEGFKGKLQRIALRLGTDVNGCERPVLNRVSEFMLKMLKTAK